MEYILAAAVIGGFIFLIVRGVNRKRIKGSGGGGSDDQPGTGPGLERDEPN